MCVYFSLSLFLFKITWNKRKKASTERNGFSELLIISLKFLVGNSCDCCRYANADKNRQQQREEEEEEEINEQNTHIHMTSSKLSASKYTR